MANQTRHIGRQVAPAVAAAYRSAARESVENNVTIEVRDGALVSPQSRSAQVQAWFWMEGSGAPADFRQGAADHYGVGEAVQFTAQGQVDQLPGRGAWVEGWILVQGVLDTAEPAFQPRRIRTPHEFLLKAPNLGGHGVAEVPGIGPVDFRWTYRSGDGVVMVNDDLRHHTVPIPVPESVQRLLSRGEVNDHVEDQLRLAVEADIRFAQEQRQFRHDAEEAWTIETGYAARLERLPAGPLRTAHDDPKVEAGYEAWSAAQEYGGVVEQQPTTEYLRQFDAPTSVQTILFDRDVFTKRQAKDWARDHNFRYGKVDAKPNTWRLRQYDPDETQRGTFRTKEVTPGVKFVFAVRQGARFQR